MNIIYLCNNSSDYFSTCPSASEVPGEEIMLSLPFWGVFGHDLRIVESVPSDRVLLLDTCAPECTLSRCGTPFSLVQVTLTSQGLTSSAKSTIAVLSCPE